QDHRHKNVLFRGENQVQRRTGHLRAPGQVRHRRTPEAVTQENLFLLGNNFFNVFRFHDNAFDNYDSFCHIVKVRRTHFENNNGETIMSTILVTGGSGFIGSYCILQLLAAGHEVRTTVRNLKREADVRAMLKTGGAESGEQLSVVAADLEKDAGWAKAVAGCEYVLHVAS